MGRDYEMLSRAGGKRVNALRKDAVVIVLLVVTLSTFNVASVSNATVSNLTHLDCVDENTLHQFDIPLDLKRVVMTPASTQLEIGPDNLPGLNDTAARNLTHSAGPFTGIFQWDSSIRAGRSIPINSDGNELPASIPEPATMFLLGSGMLSLGLSLRRTFRKNKRL